MVLLLLGPALAMAFRSTSSPATSGASHTGLVAEVQVAERCVSAITRTGSPSPIMPVVMV
ncbi:hypothetical protein ACQPZA_27325 [Pseudonocardia xinjiangensis]|uniref:hypothetical protein n=1 Tax=Pseudonocardia xinjiangensis TaxID=75289 RepID=UPI003D8F33BC